MDRSLERLGCSLYREKAISLGEKGTFEPPLLLGKMHPETGQQRRAGEFSMTFLPRGHFNL